MTSRESNRSHHTGQFMFSSLVSVVAEKPLLNLRCHENEFSEPLPSKWTSAWMNVQWVMTRSLRNTLRIRWAHLRCPRTVDSTTSGRFCKREETETSPAADKQLLRQSFQRSGRLAPAVSPSHEASPVDLINLTAFLRSSRVCVKRETETFRPVVPGGKAWGYENI
jgi:hypothetical protein